MRRGGTCCRQVSASFLRGSASVLGNQVRDAVLYSICDLQFVVDKLLMHLVVSQRGFVQRASHPL